MDARPLKVTGKVLRENVDAGSKSEREAVVLETGAGSKLVLRSQNGPAFGDTTLDELVGCSITATGVQVGRTLIMKDWQREG
jgi:hypothetical protein